LKKGEIKDEYLEKLNLNALNRIPAAIHIFEKNTEKIDLVLLCGNVNAIHLI